MLPNLVWKTTLEHGLRIITAPLKGVKSVTVLILVGAGSRYETKKQNGLSHFLEHMFFKGTKKRPTPFAIFSAIDSVGGEFNGFTEKDFVGFYIKLPSAHLLLALDILSDCLLCSQFNEEEIEREKQVVLEEMNFRRDRPTVRVVDLFETLLYGDTPLGREIIGTEETVQGFSRRNLLSWMKRFFLSPNLVVIIAGDFSREKIPNLISSYFSHLPKKKIPRFSKVKDLQKEPQLLLHFKQTDQAHIALGVRAYPLRHKNRYPLALLNIILGGNASSRLFVEIREKRGLAYYVHSSRQSYLDVGYWAVYAGLDIKRVEEGIEVILGQMREIAKRGVEEEELHRAKEYMKGRLVLSLEDSKKVASFYGEQELLEKELKTPKEIINQIEKVTREDLWNVAREIFLPERLNLAVIGPYRDREKLQKLLVI